MTVTRTRNRRGDGRLLRTEILSAATELLDSTGDERTVTLRAVARRVGITAPSIYRHFADQPSIMLAVIEQGFAELAEQLRSAVDAADDDPRRRLGAACQAYVEFARSRPERYRTMFGGTNDPIRRVAADELSATITIFTDTLTDCVAAGRSRSADPAADALSLWLGLHGLAHQRAVSTSFPWPTDITRRIATALSHLVH